MKKVSLLFGIHMHQPVDNFDEAIERAVTLSYAPFFETMVRYPQFHFSVHCSGWLLTIIKKKYCKLFENMQTLTKEGSIEWLSAGYYEPVLSSIPSCDRVAQIKKLNKTIKKYFQVKPKGLWLTERVWESSLVSDLSACGIKYAMVDDYHFLSNHYDAKKMDGYYTTEDNAETLSLFPIAKKLRYALPFAEVSDAIEDILSFKKEDNAAAILFDDAEKFGLWPDTHTWVYERGWLEKFVNAVLTNGAIQTQHYSEYMKNNRSLGLAYLNNCSYSEMGEWSLQVSDIKALQQVQSCSDSYVVQGGIWKNFFIKYHESNYLHKRMLYLSQKQKDFDSSTLENLYKLQTNDVFWHGVFGGLYLPSLRDNAYKYLLSIEKANAPKKIRYEYLDIDKDGYNELKVLTPELSLLISSKNGAQLIELGSLETLFNWQNTIMRREENYHREILEHKDEENEVAKKEQKHSIETIHTRTIAIEDSFKKELIYDWHQKNSFIDHFSRKPFTLENFISLTFCEIGDFANEPFVMHNKKFVREGGLYIQEGIFPAILQKKYSFTQNSVGLKSALQTSFAQRLYFAQEFNFHFAHPERVTFNGHYIEDGLTLHDIKKVVILDDFTKKSLTLTINKKCNLFAFILNTISKSESGFEKIAQQISFIFTGSFEKSLKLTYNLEVENV